MTSLAKKSKKYAKLPTFVEIVDVLVAGFGVDKNSENALGKLAMFEHRSRLYNGSDVGGLRNFSKNSRNKSDEVAIYDKKIKNKSPDSDVSQVFGKTGLRDDLLSLLAGPNEEIKNSLSCCLDLIENEVSNGLSAPLVTEYSREDGLYILINGWAMRWIIPLMRESDAYPTSILHFVKKILMQENCDSLKYLKIWKIFIKSLLPKGAKATEFRSIIDRIDNSSQRKLASIEKDMANLREELTCSDLEESEVKLVIEKIRAAYIAGMTTLRFHSMMLKACPALDLINCLVEFLRVAEEIFQKRQANYKERQSLPRPTVKSDYVSSSSVVREDSSRNPLQDILIKMGDRAIPDEIQFLLDPGMHQWSEKRFEKQLVKVCSKKSNEIFMPYIKYAQGVWHLGHEKHELAEKYLTDFISFADDRQLGIDAAKAASLLIALRLLRAPSPKYLELSSLVQIRIDSMGQENVMEFAVIPTPFCWRSHLPEISMYDTHILESVWHFNTVPKPPSHKLLCNPIGDFLVKVNDYVLASKKEGARLPDREKNASAVIGTSIKPYDAVCYTDFYILKLFNSNFPDFTGLDVYKALSEADQRRVLRYIDEERYLQDCSYYEISA